MRGRLLAIGLVSASGLMWEVTLTRLFSAVLQYHYVFLAVSLAVLGLGLGAVLLATTRRGGLGSAGAGERDAAAPGVVEGARGGAGAGTETPPLLVYLCSGLALALPLAALAILGLGNLESLALYSVLAIVPFILAGVVVSALFMLSPGAAGALYGADLLGAGAGAGAVVALLDAWGPLGAALALGPLCGVAAVALAWPSRPRRGASRPLSVAAGAAVLAAALWGVNLVAPLAGLNLGAGQAAPPDKTMLRLLADPHQKARVVWTRWDAFARTDVVRTADPSTMLLFTDGGAGSAIYRFDGDLASVAGLRDDLPYLPYQVAAAGGKRPRKVLVIGPGGGYDVLLAKLAGAAEVTAVEINGAAVAAVRHFGAYDGHIYDLPGVTTVVGDGRNFVRRSHERYDLIVLRLVYSQAAEAASHALAENYVFTTEALRDDIAHLAPGGYLAVTGHQALEALRAFITGVAALQGAGVAQSAAMQQVAVLMTNTQDPQDRPSVMLLKNGRMTRRDVAALQARKDTLNLQPLYVPYLYPGEFDKVANGSETLPEFLAGGSDYAVGPTTDDQPFFFDFNPGLPEAIADALTLAVALSAGVVVLGWLARRRRAPVPGGALRETARDAPARRRARAVRGPAGGRARFWPLAVYVALIGVAFMLTEVSLIQRFILLLGQPVLALVAVLGSLLVGAGLGSMASARVVRGDPRRLAGVAVLIALVLVAALFGLPGVVDALVPLALPARLAITVVLLCPLGFLLGMPFPSGLRLAQRGAAPGDIAFLWAINAATSVLGSTLAVSLALESGFSLALWLGALGYVGTALVAARTPRAIDARVAPATERAARAVAQG